MKSLIISKDDKISFDIFVAFKETGEVVAESTQEELLKENPTIKTEEILTVNFTFRKPTYKDNIDVASSSVSSDGESMRIDPAILRYERFVRLIEDWTLADEKGVKVPVKREMIDKLHPTFADAVLEKLDSVLA